MRDIPAITKNLLIINALMFAADFVFGRLGIDLNDMLGLHFFLSSDFHIFQIFTYMFMHAGLTHIFFNMFALWMFGRIVESVWGPKRFLTLSRMRSTSSCSFFLRALYSQSVSPRLVALVLKRLAFLPVCFSQ